MAERQITIQREVAEKEVKVERENVIINNIDNITGVFPEGTREITENGNYNVTTYERVDVNCPGVDDAFNALFPKDIGTNSYSLYRFLSDFLVALPVFTVDPAITALQPYSAQAFYALFANKTLKVVGDAPRLNVVSHLVSDAIINTSTSPNAAVQVSAKELDLSELACGPQCTIGANAGATLGQVKLPTKDFIITNIASAFAGATNLKTVDFGGGTASKTGSWTGFMNTFSNCSSLEQIIIRRDDKVFGIYSNTFTGSAVEAGTCLIYVPDNMVTKYKTDSVWSAYASQIKPLSELPEE